MIGANPTLPPSAPMSSMSRFFRNDRIQLLLIAALIALVLLPAARWWIVYRTHFQLIGRRPWPQYLTMINLAYGCTLGLACAQGTLIAGFIGWGRGSFAIRATLGLCMWLGLSLAESVMFFSCFASSESLDLYNSTMTVLSCAVILLGLHVLPMLCQVGLARLYGIEVFQNVTEARRELRWQFSLAEMMALTLVISLVLGLVSLLRDELRYVFPHGEVSIESAIKLGVLMIGNFFMLNAMITCFHVPRRWWVNGLIVIGIAILVSAIQAFSLWWFETSHDKVDAAKLSALSLGTNLVHVTYFMLMWGVLRGLGFRLERVRNPRKKSPKPQTASAT
ncbi:MAG: hypothetical protein ACO1RA_01040 [Planctomycetaceae bacterium]